MVQEPQQVFQEVQQLMLVVVAEVLKQHPVQGVGGGGTGGGGAGVSTAGPTTAGGINTGGGGGGTHAGFPSSRWIRWFRHSNYKVQISIG